MKSNTCASGGSGMSKLRVVLLLVLMAAGPLPALCADSIEEIRQAAEQGDRNSQFSLGQRYEAGKGGVERDLEKALLWYRKASGQGHAKAQFELGIAYRDGKGVQKDQVLGLMWLLLGQEKGGLAARVAAPGLLRRLKPRDRKEAWELVYQWREAHGLPRIPPRTPKPKLIRRTLPAPEKPAESEAAPKPQEGAKPADAPPQESDAEPPA